MKYELFPDYAVYLKPIYAYPASVPTPYVAPTPEMIEHYAMILCYYGVVRKQLAWYLNDLGGLEAWNPAGSPPHVLAKNVADILKASL